METINIHYRAHLTENYQIKTAQQLISKLKVQLGMEKGYSEELEEEIAKLKEELEKERIRVDELESILEAEKLKIKKLYDKYSSDVQNAVKLDDVYQKQNKKLEEKTAEIERLTKLKDMYLSELITSCVQPIYSILG